MSIPAHYPFLTQILMDLYDGGELPAVSSVMIEPEYGYVGRIAYHDGAVRLFRGANLDLNSHGAAEIARDKGYTRFFLRSLGYHVPPGRVFLMPGYAQTVGVHFQRYGKSDHAITDQIPDYVADETGYPCFIKPNDGARGQGVHKCFDWNDIAMALAALRADGVQLALVEQAVTFPEYRVVIYQGQLIACYGRQPLMITGDGQRSITQLLHDRQQQFDKAGRRLTLNSDDARLLRLLQRHHLTPDSILPAGQSLRLYDFANLSLGGQAVDLTDDIHPDWIDLCARMVADVGLDFAGIDLACSDVTGPASEAYAVIEINASPGLNHFAAMGPQQHGRVRAFYRRVINTSPKVQPC